MRPVIEHRCVAPGITEEHQMSDMKITIGADGQTVVSRDVAIEKQCADLARSIRALTEVLTLPGGLQHLSNCPESSQADVFTLLRALTHEQAALTQAMEQHASPSEREDAFRRAFRSGYSAGLQRTSSVRGEVDINEPVIRTSAGLSSAFQHGAWTEHKTEH
ncbi:hypothetical protein BVER_05920c [Candidatus Burkholderia verschuerenii]|uniref:Uncharacterized protein n=2 Tax=Candidatus Burkholderia verschuerenii TaxID=242163 RepID=A0A0L0MGP1_9BURK|nr:hypothetical protein BVER_05920c [Candidatus Burkholderia verschuerenii]